MYCVYKITNRFTGKTYIGITKDFARRMYQHARSFKHKHHGRYAFAQAVKKYGWYSFNTQILIDNVSFEDAQLLEILCIAAEDSTIEGNGYNMSCGGECPLNPKTMHGYAYTNAYGRLGVTNEHEYNSVYGRNYRLEHHVEILERESKYRQNNREQIRDKERKWYADNKDKVKSKREVYCKNNHQKVLDTKKKYREAHKEEIKFMTNSKRELLRMLRMCPLL